MNRSEATRRIREERRQRNVSHQQGQALIDGSDEILPIITFDESTDWNAVLEQAQPHLDEAGLRRLQNALGETAKTLLVERHYIDKDYRETFSDFHSKKFNTPDARCVRLHFFKIRLNRDALAGKSGMQDGDYLGYSVIRPIRPNCIGRTLLRPEAQPRLSGLLSLCEETVNIQGTDLKAEGFPFISQDADATVCAQATLWMLMRYFSNRYPIYPEVYPVQIGNLTRDYSLGRLLPTKGLYVWQMAEALRQVNFSPIIYSRHEYPKSFDHLMYTYIESGIPVLAALKKHVVVLFGHKLDCGRVRCAPGFSRDRFVFSSLFNVAFIGNDDNAFPYQVIGRGTQKAPDSMPHSISDIRQFVVPLPERVFLTAENFQKLAETVLSDEELGLDALSPSLRGQSLVLRVFLTTGKSFKKRMLDREEMGHPLVAATYRDLPLPHFIWVCELSSRELYPDKVLGEVVWDATRNPYETKGFLALHYPEKLVVDWGAALNGEPNPYLFELPHEEGYPIYTHNLKEISQCPKN